MIIKPTDMQSVKDIFFAALLAADPCRAVEGHIPHILSAYKSGGFDKLLLVSFGKAALMMAKAFSENAHDLITGGIAITKYGHAQNISLPNCIEIHEAGHPIPDKNGMEATRRAMAMLKETDEKTLIICLISGGGSALLVSPKNGITLDDKQKVTDLLLKAGASISELNTVRKHISDIKGGRLAECAYPGRIISLILSDVIGDKLDVIASGPTSPDSTTYEMAFEVIQKYRLSDKLPNTVKDILISGVEGRVADTPKEGSPVFERVENIIVGSNRKAALAAMEKAQELGFEPRVLSTELQGEAIQIAHWLAKKALWAKRSLKKKKGKKICLISGGETTVMVRGSGKGGRNTELALAFAIDIKDAQGITLLSAETDGTDGPTDAAGAIVSGESIQKAILLSLNPAGYLVNNDSYTFFRRTGELFVTGPTGTNVMDLQVILIR
jgi:hydroxypyruvate reductase/glycerate 2-kinase